MDDETNAGTIADAMRRLGCVTHEVRLQIPTGALIRRVPKRVRVVTEAPDAVSLALLRRVVEHVGGSVEGNPARLGLGVPVPDGHVLSFSLPYEDDAQSILSLG